MLLVEEERPTEKFEKRAVELEKLRTLLTDTKQDILKDEELLNYMFGRMREESVHRRSCPPNSALGILYFFFDKASRDELVGDIVEEFPSQLEKLGWRLARLWVWKEVLYAALFSAVVFIVKLWERVSPVARFFNNRH